MVEEEIQNQPIIQDSSMNRSRLSRKLEQQSKKNLFLSIFGIIVVLLILIKFGIPLLINFSLFLSGSRGSQEEAKNNITAFVPVPVLNPIPSATSSAEIILSGFAAPMQIIELYVNSDLVDKTQVKEDGTFSFREIISEGENIIKAKAIINDKKSDFSKSILVTMKNKSPYLNLVSPLDGQSFSKDQNIIDIQGTTDPNIKVTVNGFWAITDGNGNFSYRLSLQNGENNIKIVAIDEAGNKTEKELRVIYNP